MPFSSGYISTQPIMDLMGVIIGAVRAHHITFYLTLQHKLDHLESP